MNTFIENTDSTLNMAVTYFKLALAWYLKQLTIFKDVKYEVSDHSNFMDDKEHGWRFKTFLAGTGFEEQLDKVYTDLPFNFLMTMALQEMVGHKTSKPSDTNFTMDETLKILDTDAEVVFHLVCQGRLSLTFAHPAGDNSPVDHQPQFTRDSVLSMYKVFYKAALEEECALNVANIYKTRRFRAATENRQDKHWTVSILAAGLAQKKLEIQVALREGD